MLRGFANTIKHHKETPFLLLKQKDTPAIVNGVITKYLVGYHGESMSILDSLMTAVQHTVSRPYSTCSTGAFCLFVFTLEQCKRDP